MEKKNCALNITLPQMRPRKKEGVAGTQGFLLSERAFWPMLPMNNNIYLKSELK